jgi:hypothetical protein
VILEGKAVLESGARGTVIQTLGPGDHLGWTWLFPASRFVSGARAVERTEAILFYRSWPLCQGEAEQRSAYELTNQIAAVAIHHLKAIEGRLVDCAGLTAR